MRFSLLRDAHSLHHIRRANHGAIAASATFDLIYNIHAFGHFSNNRLLVVQASVFRIHDKELAVRRVRVA